MARSETLARAIFLAILLVALIQSVASVDKISVRSKELLEDAAKSEAYVKETVGPKNMWLVNGNLARATGVKPFKQIFLPVNVNVFVIGLDGSGNLGVRLPTKQIHEWLEHLENVVPHSMLPTLGTPESQSMDEVELMNANFSEAANVQYRYKFNVVETHARVTEVLERFLHARHRKVPLEGDRKGMIIDELKRTTHVRYQVDPNELSALLDDLVRSLRLEGSYSIFVLNPKAHWPKSPGSRPLDYHYKQIPYGYRSGFSNNEIDELLEQNALKPDKLKNTASAPHPQEFKSDPPSDDVDIADLVSDESKFRELEEEAANNHQADDEPHMLLDFTEDSRKWAEKKLREIRTPGPISTSDYSKSLSHTEWGRRYLQWVKRNNFAQEDCLVDTWVSPYRLTFIDLTAGPFSWGPVVGGEGVRTTDTLPHVDTFASIHADPGYRKKPLDSSDDINDPADKHKALGYEDDFNTAGDADKEFTKTEHTWESLEAQKVLYYDYLRDRCVDEKMEPRLTKKCQEVRERVIELETYMAKHDRSKFKAADISDKNAFSFFNDGFSKGHHFNMEVDHFLSQLSATLATTLNHVVTPSAGDYTAKYASRVTFQIYVLSNHKSYDALDHDFLELLKAAVSDLRLPRQEFVFATHVLNMADDPALSVAYANSLRSAVVPTLRLDGSFSAIKRLYLDSQVLADQLDSVHVEKRISKHKPTKRRRKRVRSSERIRKRVYRKAMKKESRNHRKRHGKKRKRASRTKHKSASNRRVSIREIPIFIFSLDHPLPVFVDKYYQSKTVNGMVVAVQSKQHLWESHLACNQKSIYWNLRDPVRSVASSVATVLGGLVPQHVAYSDAHNRTMQNWLWSVGSNPMAQTGSGLSFSQMHKDTVHRNYIVNAIREATHIVNIGVSELQDHPTTLGNEVLRSLHAKTDDEKKHLQEMLHSKPSKLVVTTVAAIRVLYMKMWRLIADIWTDVDHLAFAEAIDKLPKLEKLANRFKRLSDRLLIHAESLECASAPAEERLETGYYLAASVLCLFMLLVRVLTPGDNKPKLN